MAMSLKDRIKEIRGPLSQDAAAKRSGITQQMWSKLERGTTIETTALPAIAKAFGLDLHWLTYGTASAEPLRVGEVSAPTYIERSSDEFSIPKLNVAASMGDGTYPPEHVEVLQSLTVNLPQLRKLASFTAPKNLRFITGLGDSMIPTFGDGDPLLIDVGITKADIDAVYVFSLNGSLYIKTLQRQPDGLLTMISDNKKYQPYVIKPTDELLIHAKVCLAWNSRKL